GQYNITVNCIAPGVTMTEATKKIVPEGIIDMLPAMSAMKRKLEPEDLAGTAVFFASDDAALVTGQVLCVDGGSVMPAYRPASPARAHGTAWFRYRPVRAGTLLPAAASKGSDAVRRDDVLDGPGDASGRPGSRRRGTRLRVDVRPGAHAHPDQSADAAADGRCRVARLLQARLRPVRRAHEGRGRHRASPGRDRHLSRRPARPDRHREIGGEPRPSLGRPVRLRDRIRVERGRGRGSRRRDAAPPGRRSRARARDA